MSSLETSTPQIPWYKACPALIVGGADSPPSSSQGIVRQLCGSDAQLFAGWGGHPGVNDPVILDRLWKLSLKTAALLKV